MMVADTLRDFLENGNIRHSVNFPEAALPRVPATARIAIANSNVPNMVGQISTRLAEAGLNIADLLNKSKGEVAYTLIDIDGRVPAGLIEKIGSHPGRAWRAGRAMSRIRIDSNDSPRPAYAGLAPYVPGKPPETARARTRHHRTASSLHPTRIRSARDRMRARRSPHAIAGVGHYPDGSGHVLRSRLAATHKVSRSSRSRSATARTTCSVLLAEAFLTPGLEAVHSQLRICRLPDRRAGLGCHGEGGAGPPGRPRPAAWPRSGRDPCAAVGPKTRMVFLANPNNPTGTWLDENRARGLLQAIPGDVIVVLDEAYHEYSAPLGIPDGTRWLARHPNLVVTRTFSKAYGLAGLRVGYALSHPDIARPAESRAAAFQCLRTRPRGGCGGPRRSRAPRCDARAQSRRTRAPARRPSEARPRRAGIRRQFRAGGPRAAGGAGQRGAPAPRRHRASGRTTMACRITCASRPARRRRTSGCWRRMADGIRGGIVSAAAPGFVIESSRRNRRRHPCSRRQVDLASRGDAGRDRGRHD